MLALNELVLRLSRPFRSEPAVERAPYALPPGVPALQWDPDRRRNLAIAALVVVLLAVPAGYLLGRSVVPAHEVHSTSTIVDPRALEVAHSSTAVLVGETDRFLESVARTPDDPMLWSGVTRLAGLALDDPSDDGRELARRIADALGSASCPSELRGLRVVLERHSGGR